MDVVQINVTGLGSYSFPLFVPSGYSAVSATIQAEPTAQMSYTNTQRRQWAHTSGGFLYHLGIDLNGTNSGLFDFMVEYCDT